MMDNILKRLLKGTFWSVAATGLSSVFNLLAGVICARTLGKEVFGQMGVLQSTVGFVGLLAGLGLGTTATRFVSRYLLSDPARCGRLLGGILLMAASTIFAGSLLLLLGARVVAANWLQSPGLETPVRICAAWVFALAAGELIMAALAGLESFRAVAAQSFIRGSLVFVGTVAGLRWGLEGALVGWSFGLAASGLVLLRVLWRECARHGIRISYIKSAEDVRSVLGYALPTLISGLASAPFVWFANTIIVRNPGGYEQMALLTVVYQWRGVFTYLPVSVSRVVLPLLSSSDTASVSHAGQAFAISNLVNQFVVWGGGIVLLCLSGVLLSFYGEGFQSGRVAFTLVLGGTMVGFAGNSLGSLILARGLLWLGIAGNLLTGLSLVVCVLLISHQRGAVAVGIGTMIGYTLNLSLCVTVLTWRKEISAQIGWRIFGAAMAAVIIVLAMAQASPLVAAAAGVLILPASLVAVFQVFAKPEGFSLSSLLSFTRKSEPRTAV